MDCLNCNAMRQHVAALETYVSQLQAHIGVLNEHLVRSNEAAPLVEQLTALLQQRERVIHEQSKELDSLKVQITLYKSEAETLRKGLAEIQTQQRDNSADALQRQQVPNPVHGDGPLSTSMLAPNASASHVGAASSVPVTAGMQSHAVPLLSGTQRAQVVEHMARAALASSTVGPSTDSAAGDSSAEGVPIYARRRALFEKEGQSGARPHALAPPVRYDNSRGPAAQSGPPGPALHASLTSLAASQAQTAQPLRAGPPQQSKPVHRPGFGSASQASEAAPSQGAGQQLGQAAMTATHGSAAAAGAVAAPVPAQTSPLRHSAASVAASLPAAVATTVQSVPPETSARIQADLRFLQNAHAALAQASLRAAGAGTASTAALGSSAGFQAAAPVPSSGWTSAGLPGSLAEGFVPRPAAVQARGSQEHGHVSSMSQAAVETPVARPTLVMRPLAATKTTPATALQVVGGTVGAQAVSSARSGPVSSLGSAGSAAGSTVERPGSEDELLLGSMRVVRLTQQLDLLRSSVAALQAS